MRHNNRYTDNNEAVLIRGGRDYFSRLLGLIQHAKHHFHLQVYIFEDDETGQLVAGALKEAAARKVSVYVLADGYASQSLSDELVDDLMQAGIHFLFFEPLFRSRSYYFGRRLHHKVAVADGEQALVGGINIGNRYNDLPGAPAWLDFAVYTQGQVAHELYVLCIETWNSAAGKADRLKAAPSSAPSGLAPGNAKLRLSRNDWVQRRNEISRTYVEMLITARSEVTILCSYFLPGKIIRKHIVRAAKRGIRINVIAAGKSDVVLAKKAERWLYDWLLRHDIKIYEYYGNVLHGKMAICDNEMATIGSYNINNISTYASIELNLDIRDEKFAEGATEMLQQIMKDQCVAIMPNHRRYATNIFSQFTRWCSYQIIRIIFYVFTFYFKRRSSKSLRGDSDH
jgi:cardiolipin synthase